MFAGCIVLAPFPMSCVILDASAHMSVKAAAHMNTSLRLHNSTFTEETALRNIYSDMYSVSESAHSKLDTRCSCRPSGLALIPELDHKRIMRFVDDSKLKSTFVARIKKHQEQHHSSRVWAVSQRNIWCLSLPVCLLISVLGKRAAQSINLGLLFFQKSVCQSQTVDMSAITANHICDSLIELHLILHGLYSS
jgi:hypothetical protein